MHSFANCHYADSDAALLERWSLEAMERSPMVHDGAFVTEQVKTHARSVIRHSMIMWEFYEANVVQSYLCHRLNGVGAAPSDEDHLRKNTAGTYVYPSGGIVLHNHPRGITSFSWRNRTMILPNTRDGVKLVGPSDHSVLGTYKVSGIGRSENLRKLVIRELPDRVSVLMIQDIVGDSIRRHVLFCSLPDGKGISYEVARALEDLTVEECTLGCLQIINDNCFGDHGLKSSRKLYWLGGEREFEGYITGSPDEDVTCELTDSGWLNVDDRLGFRFRGTGKAVYVNKHFYEVFHAVYDELILGRHEPGRSFKAGDKVAELTVLWCPEQLHEDTQRQSFEVLKASEDMFAADVDGWLCACNFTVEPQGIRGVTLEPMEPRIARLP